MTLSGFLSLVRRRRLTVLLTFGALLAGTSAFVLNLPNEYSAELKFMVRRARAESTVGAHAAFSGPVQNLSEGELISEIELFRNRESLKKVAVQIGLVNEVDELIESERARVAMAVREFDRRLTVHRVGTSNLIHVSYVHTDPKLAAQVVRFLTDTYMAKHLEVHQRREAAAFFDHQTDRRKRELDQAQQALALFRRKHRISSLETEKAATLAREKELVRQLQGTDSEIRYAQSRIAHLRSQVADMPQRIETSNGTHQREILLDRSYSVNPLRQSLKGDLLRAESMLSGLHAKRTSTVQDLAEVRAELTALDGITTEHDDLVRSVKLAEESYLLYSKKLEESELEAALDRQRILNISVVEEVEVPPVPIEKHRVAMLIVATIMAGFGSLLMAFLIDVVRRRDVAEAQTGDKLIRRRVAAVTERDDAASLRSKPKQYSRKQEPIPISRVHHQGPANVTAETAVVSLGPKGEFSELTADEVRLLRGGDRPDIVGMLSRDLVLRDDYGRIIDHLSSVRDGKQGISIGLAPGIGAEKAAVAAVQLSYSLQRRNGLPVLLVDAAAGRDPLAKYFGFDRASGLSELLTGPDGCERECVHRTGFGELWILPDGGRGRKRSSSPERVSSLHDALTDRSINLIVRLPNGGAGGVTVMLYSILDAVLSSLSDSATKEGDTADLVRRVVEAKRNYSERRLTLIGAAKEWASGNAESLTVC